MPEESADAQQAQEEVNAATKMQAVWRGKQARKETGGEACITVGLRMRPFVPHELKKGPCEACITISSNVVKVVPEAGLDEKEAKEGPWKFDKVMDSSNDKSAVFVDNAKCYDLMGRGMIDDVLAGFNTCLFCYGQTGTGKTTTIMGDEHNGPGILRRLLDDIFLEAERLRKEGAEVNVEMQMLEVYNEEFRDLLLDKHQPPAKIQTHILPGGVTVSGAISKEVNSADECQKEIDFGNSNKTIAATQMNPQSSRGHTVFKLTFKKTGGSDGNKLSSEVYFADLAGHENIKTTAVTGDRLKELTFINSSLMWLQNALHSMAQDSGKKGKHKVDFSKFRNSKLTLLLSNALTGNSKTQVIVTLSPSTAHFETSLSSIKFAMEVKGIKVTATSTAGKDPKAVIEKLEHENAELKEQLAKAEAQPGAEAVQAAQAAREEVAQLREELAEARAAGPPAGGPPLATQQRQDAPAGVGGVLQGALDDGRLDAALAGVDGTRAAQDSRQQQLEAEVSELRAQLAAADGAGAAGASQASAAAKEEVAELRQQLTAAEAAGSRGLRAEQEAAELRGQLGSAKAQLQEREERALQDSRALKRETADLREQLAAASKQQGGQEELKSENAELRKRLTAALPYREHVSELKDQLDGKTSLAATLRDEVDVLKDQLAKAQQSSGGRDHTALSEQITKLGERMASDQNLKAEVSELREQLLAARREGGSGAQEQTRALQDEVVRLKAQLAVAQASGGSSGPPSPSRLQGPPSPSRLYGRRDLDVFGKPISNGVTERDAAMEQMNKVLELSKKNVDLFGQLLRECKSSR